MAKIRVFVDGKPYRYDTQTKQRIPYTADPPPSCAVTSPEPTSAGPNSAVAPPPDDRRPSSLTPASPSAVLTPEQRGQVVFQHLAELARRERPTGVGYADFWAVTHGKKCFQDVEGRGYENMTDTSRVLALAHRVTKQNGRISVTRHGVTIQTGMDSYIWNRAAERPHGAFSSTPYKESDWLLVFPNGLRRLADPADLLRVVDGQTATPLINALEDGATGVRLASAEALGILDDERVGGHIQNAQSLLVASSGHEETQSKPTVGIPDVQEPATGEQQWQETVTDDTGSLYTGEIQLSVGDVIQICGEPRQRCVTYVMGSDRKGWRACFKGQGAVPKGNVFWRLAR